VDVSDAEVNAASGGLITSCTQAYLFGGCTHATYGAMSREKCCASCTTGAHTPAPTTVPTDTPTPAPTEAPSDTPTAPATAFVGAGKWDFSHRLIGDLWLLVRHVSSISTAWHPATDQMSGTDVYGTYDPTVSGATTTENFSIEFASKNCEKFLFATADLSQWLVG
jgi:hypothetical protein